jgi:hypothetical protein
MLNTASVHLERAGIAAILDVVGLTGQMDQAILAR